MTVTTSSHRFCQCWANLSRSSFGFDAVVGQGRDFAKFSTAWTAFSCFSLCGTTRCDVSSIITMSGTATTSTPEV
ncbi:hypothetical protein ABZ438_20735 [Streptomyces sp. NPDC005786]|uniref:hypothetical protein n=1 Tax=Streptomyces sp. NPDC005786 TaxID=3154891 RepID=UPI0033EFC31D